MNDILDFWVIWDKRRKNALSLGGIGQESFDFFLLIELSPIVLVRELILIKTNQKVMDLMRGVLAKVDEVELRGFLIHLQRLVMVIIVNHCVLAIDD